MDSQLTHRPSVKNIKIHFTIDNLYQLFHGIIGIIDLKLSGDFAGKTFSRGHNFIVYKNRFVYTIFYNKGYINCTKIPNYSGISEAISEFCDTFGLTRQDLSSGITIDNTTSSGKFKHRLNLLELKHKIEQADQYQEIRTKFNPSFFPGLFVKYHFLGTIILFASGKYSVVGAKCQNQSEQIVENIYFFLNNGGNTRVN